jgi:hypothetical protein
MIIVYIIIFLIILIFLYEINCANNTEHASFLLDQLNGNIPQNPEVINEIESRANYRIVTIEGHVKLDKNGRIEYITYSKPLPESGELGCYKVKCPAWVTNIACWKCV